jgi:hypothetical protein
MGVSGNDSLEGTNISQNKPNLPLNLQLSQQINIQSQISQSNPLPLSNSPSKIPTNLAITKDNHILQPQLGVSGARGGALGTAIGTVGSTGSGNIGVDSLSLLRPKLGLNKSKTNVCTEHKSDKKSMNTLPKYGNSNTANTASFLENNFSLQPPNQPHPTQHSLLPTSQIKQTIGPQSTTHNQQNNSISQTPLPSQSYHQSGLNLNQISVTSPLTQPLRTTRAVPIQAIDIVSQLDHKQTASPKFGAILQPNVATNLQNRSPHLCPTSGQNGPNIQKSPTRQNNQLLSSTLNQPPLNTQLLHSPIISGYGMHPGKSTTATVPTHGVGVGVSNSNPLHLGLPTTILNLNSGNNGQNNQQNFTQSDTNNINSQFTPQSQQNNILPQTTTNPMHSALYPLQSNPTTVGPHILGRVSQIGQRAQQQLSQIPRSQSNQQHQPNHYFQPNNMNNNNNNQTKK